MKREQRHMPCRFKVDRTRARYTRVHKLLAQLRDQLDDPLFGRHIRETGVAVYRAMPYTDLTVCLEQKLKRTYIVTVTERKEKLHEAVGEDLRGIVDKLFWKTLGDEVLDLARVSGVLDAKKSWWESTEGRHTRITVEGNDPVHGPFRIPVDVDIAPLVVKLNMAGIRTRYSCQGDPGNPLSAYVTIEPEDDNETARAIVFGFWHDKYVYRSDRHNAYYMSETYLGKQRFKHLDEEPCDYEEPVHRPDKEADNGTGH